MAVLIKNIQWQYTAFTSSANFIKFDPVTPDITGVTTALFWMRWQKSADATEYFRNY